MSRITWRVPDGITKKPRDKNLVFCPGASRTKLQFGSLKEALLYLRWNSEEIRKINKKAPIRAYWCDPCRCYHVTSRTLYTSDKKREIEKNLELGRQYAENNPKLAKEYIQESYRELMRNSLENSPWATEIADGILEVSRVIEKKEFDLKVKEAEYLLRLRDWSKSEIVISWLENNNLNPEKTERLRKKLMHSMGVIE